MKEKTTMNNETTKIAFSVEEIAKQTSLSKSYIRKEIKRGNLQAKNFGRRVLILAEDLNRYLQRK